jgi:general secretion pathway protein B
MLMSLILEALKKSEQQRRIGQVPNLGTPVIGTRRRRSLLPFFALLIAVAIAAAAWLRFGPAPAGPGAPTPAEHGAPGTSPGPDIARTQPEPPKAPPRAAPRAMPAPAAGSSAGAAAPAQDRPLSAYERERLRVTGLLPKSSRDRHPAPRALPPAPPPAEAAAKPAQPAAAPAAPASKPATEAGTPAPGTPPPAAAVAPTTPAAAVPASAPVPYRWELPFATRKDLPPLEISMHVYADAPGRRMAVIDGETYHEGDAVGEGLSVREIRPDGVVMDLAGKLFLLPAGG